MEGILCYLKNAGKSWVCYTYIQYAQNLLKKNTLALLLTDNDESGEGLDRKLSKTSLRDVHCLAIYLT